MGGFRGSARRNVRTAAVASACAALGLGGVLTGLAGSSWAAPLATSVTNITFWNQYNQTDKEWSTMVNTVIPAFEKANPGIKVNPVFYNDNVIETKFIAAAAAGSPPDVMRADITDVPALANQGTLTDLSQVLPNYKALTAEALPGPLATNLWKGQYYGFPLDTNTQALFWNKALFTAAGLSGPPKTLSQLTADAAKLTDKAKGVYGLGVDGTDVWNTAPYVWSSGGAFTNPTLTKVAGYMDSHATETAIQNLVNLDKSGDIGTDFLGGTGAVSGETGFPKGQYAMYVDGPWAVPTFAAETVPAYGIALFPSGPGGTDSTVGGEDVIIPKGTTHLAAAEKFAEFLDKPMAQLAMAAQGDMAVEKNDAAAEVKATPSDAVFAKQLLTAKDRPVVPGYATLDTDWSNALGQILAGKMSVDAALTAAAQQANTALASP